MVDVVNKRIWFPDRKLRSVNKCFWWPDLELLVGLDASRLTYWGFCRAEPPWKREIAIVHVSVVRSILNMHERTDLVDELWVGPKGESDQKCAKWLLETMS